MLVPMRHLAKRSNKRADEKNKPKSEPHVGTKRKRAQGTRDHQKPSILLSMSLAIAGGCTGMLCPWNSSPYLTQGVSGHVMTLHALSAGEQHREARAATHASFQTI